MELELRINGVTASQDIAPGESLLTLLRREGYCSVKQGCETGECGACTVLVDGIARPSCVMLAAQAGGCALTTAESLGTAERLHPLQAAFIEVGAVQCGFCTPGMLLSAQSLLARNPAPTESDVRDALSGNLCRCTGYEKPVLAVMRAAAILRGEDVPELIYNTIDATEDVTLNTRRLLAVSGSSARLRAVRAESVTNKIPALTASAAVVASKRSDVQQVIGKSLPTINAAKLATGQAVFTGDFALHDMLYACILTSPHAHAIIRDIDVSEARALSGVHAVLTYKDIPHIPYSAGTHAQGLEGVQDQYCLDSVVRYVGDRVAVVAAETPEIAEQALSLIQVRYDVQPAIFDLRQASEAGAPRLHAEAEARGIYDAARNIVARVRSDVGDVEQAFAMADLVVEGEYLTAPLQPAPMEKHTALTYFDEEGRLVVRTSSQSPHTIRRALSTVLGLPLRRIRIVSSAVGGSFGAKQGLAFEDLCALLTLVTRRPVKLVYSRADELRAGHPYRQYIMRLKTGVKRDGTIIANQLVLLADTGAYATHSLITHENAVSALALYPCPHMRFVAEVLYTNHAPVGTFQGYALPQECFALETHIDEVARQLGIDALVLRRKNWIKVSGEYPLLRDQAVNKDAVSFVESCGLPACLNIVTERLKWDERHRLVEEGRFRHGVGIALALHATPPGQIPLSGAMIKLNEDGSFDVFSGVSDSGSGATTILVQIVAEVLGVYTDDILLHTSDTDVTPFEVAVSDSALLYGSGGAVQKAAEQMRRQILSVAGRMLNVLPESLKTQHAVITGPNERQVTIAQVAAYSHAVENRHIMTTASWKAQYAPITFAVQGVQVEVDTETGSVRVLKVVTAVDGGNPLNPQLVEGQIQGSVARALGLAISEELLYDPQGALLTTNLRDYHVYTAPDMPEMQTYLIETSSAAGPFGAKSAAEIALYAIAPAIANAIADAVDVKMRQLPLSPERLLRALHAKMAKRP